MVKRILLVIVAGALIGLAAFYIQFKRGKIEINESPEPSITQTQDEEVTEEEILQGRIFFEVAEINPGDRIKISRVKLLRPGFVVVLENEDLTPESVLGTSDFIQTGTRENIDIVLNRKINSGETVYVGLHSDNGNEIFDAPKTDIPINTRGAQAVRKKYIVGQ